MPRNLSEWAPPHANADSDASPWWIGVGLAIATGVAYFVGARLSLALLTKPDGVAVFWPAAGISAGLLISYGPRARWPVAAAVMTATVAANQPWVGRGLRPVQRRGSSPRGVADPTTLWFAFQPRQCAQCAGPLWRSGRCSCGIGSWWNGWIHSLPLLGDAILDHVAQLVCF